MTSLPQSFYNDNYFVLVRMTHQDLFCFIFQEKVCHSLNKKRFLISFQNTSGTHNDIEILINMTSLQQSQQNDNYFVLVMMTHQDLFCFIFQEKVCHSLNKKRFIIWFQNTSGTNNEIETLLNRTSLQPSFSNDNYFVLVRMTHQDLFFFIFF